MQVRKIMVVMAVLAGFVGAPVSRAFADDVREPSAADSSTKHKKKKKKGAKRGKKHSAKKSTHHARAKKSKGGTHYPTQPGGSGGFDNIPADKKDDLPPPQTPAN